LFLLMLLSTKQIVARPCDYDLLATMYTWCNNFSDLTSKQKQVCRDFAHKLACLTDEQINSAQLDIFLTTGNSEVLKLDPRDLRKALFFIAHHESRFKYKRGLYDKHDICYLQVNVSVWPLTKRKRHLLISYTDGDILNSYSACIDTGLRILLYAYAIKGFRLSSSPPYTAYLAQIYHAPFDTRKTRRYRSRILRSIKDALD